jgi:hypothetical protein
MKATDLPNHTNAWLLRFSLAEMPHATIETNRSCNIRCENCYNAIRDYVKPLPVVIEEIELLLIHRKLQTLTLMGGEPTLHPDLPAIVRYVRSKRLKCQILTNGIAFLEDNGVDLLDALIKDGVDRITVHVDKGQRHVHKDIERVRRRLFDLLESRKCRFALSITIDSAERAAIPGMIRKYARYKYFDGVIGFMASDLFSPKYPGRNLETESRAITAELGLQPTCYIPSNMDDNEIRWLLYYYMIDSQTQTTYQLPPRFSRMFCRVHRMLLGHFPFMVHVPPLLSGITCILVMLTNPGSYARTRKDSPRLFRRILSAFSTRFQYVVFQVPPEIAGATDVIELCHNCPDATIRNGRLLPLCLADYISPFDPKDKIPQRDQRFEAIAASLNPPQVYLD